MWNKNNKLLGGFIVDNEINKILEICEKEGEYQGDVNSVELKRIKELEKEGRINLISNNSELGHSGKFVHVMLKNNSNY